MEFWGVEIKSGQPSQVEPGEGKVLHLSQACLGEVKKDKGSESIHLYVTVDGKKLVLGTLSPEKFPQQQFDLVFDKKFELSHSWKNGSVYFHGYICVDLSNQIEDDSEAESDEEFPVNIADGIEIGKSKSEAKPEKSPAADNANAAKPGLAAAKQKVKIVEPMKDVKTVEEEEDDSSDEEDDSSDEEDNGDSPRSADSPRRGFYSDEDEDDDSESEEDESEDEDTPKKVEPSKKRPAESATGTPGVNKKTKLVTPQKTDTKKGGRHVDTPHPAKQAGKTPANQTKQQSPKSAGSHPCKSCNRSFNSENALESHTKAKHSAGK